MLMTVSSLLISGGFTLVVEGELPDQPGCFSVPPAIGWFFAPASCAVGAPLVTDFTQIEAPPLGPC